MNLYLGCLMKSTALNWTGVTQFHIGQERMCSSEPYWSTIVIPVQLQKVIKLHDKWQCRSVLGTTHLYSAQQSSLAARIHHNILSGPM